MSLIVVSFLLLTILVACVPPTPQVIEKVVKQTVVVEVEKEKVVEKTVIVEQTKVVEKSVEKVVTATPVPPTAVPVVPKEKQMGGTVNVWLPNSWPDKSWLYLTNWESNWAVSPMAENLFWPKSDGTLEPLLGLNYTVTPDGLVYTVKLRPNVKWHDGETFTAEDVEYTILLHAHPKLQPLAYIRTGLTIKDYKNYHDGKADKITGMRVIDPLTIEFTLDSRDASFARTFLCGFEGPEVPILPKHIVSKLDQAKVLNNSDPYWITKPIGTGPYKFVKYVEQQYIEYARNENYWGGKVGPEKLFMKISSPEVAMIMLEKGELDYMQPTQLTEISRLKATPNLELVEADNAGLFWGLIPNSETMNGAWRNPKIKQALLKSVDRQGYVNTILQGYGAVRNSPFEGSAYGCPTLTKWTYEPEVADKLWTDAGWPKDKRGTWTMDFMSWLGNKPRLDYLPILQEAMRKLGFKANVDLIDNSLVTDYISGKGPRGRDWDTMVLAWGPGADPQTMSVLAAPDNPINAGVLGCPDQYDEAKRGTCWKYENKQVADLFDKTATETDPAKRTKYFQEIDCILNQDIPFFTTASPKYILSKSKRLQGVDWVNNANLGRVHAMYKPGDFWIWDPTKK